MKLLNFIKSLLKSKKSIDGIIYYSNDFQGKRFLQPHNKIVLVSDNIDDRVVRKHSISFFKRDLAILPIYSDVFEDT